MSTPNPCVRVTCSDSRLSPRVVMKITDVAALHGCLTDRPLPDGAVAGSHDREVSLVLESSASVPLHHRLTLQYLLTHLAKVTQAQASNGLDTHTLGQIFGPLLIRRGPTTSWYVWLDSYFVPALLREASLPIAKFVRPQVVAGRGVLWPRGGEAADREDERARAHSSRCVAVKRVPPGCTVHAGGSSFFIAASCELCCLFSVLPAKPAKSKMAPSAMTDTSSLLTDAEWYWGEISR